MKDFTTMPLSELTTPHEGRVVYLNRYWVVTPDDCVLFYTKGRCYSPQCNHNKGIARRVLDTMKSYPEGSRIEFIPIAYIPAKAIYQ